MSPLRPIVVGPSGLSAYSFASTPDGRIETSEHDDAILLTCVTCAAAMTTLAAIATLRGAIRLVGGSG